MRFVIDPGHGPGNVKDGVYDPGASGNGIEEAAYVMAFSGSVAARLRHQGHEVIMTRELGDRTNKPIARRPRLGKGCDMYLAIHCNAAANSSAGGTEAWTSKSKAAQEVAAAMSEGVSSALQIVNRGLKIDSSNHFAVIRLTSCPAAILEIGFLSNPHDAASMLDIRKKDLAIEAVVDALCLI